MRANKVPPSAFSDKTTPSRSMANNDQIELPSESPRNASDAQRPRSPSTTSRMPLGKTCNPERSFSECLEIIGGGELSGDAEKWGEVCSDLCATTVALGSDKEALEQYEFALTILRIQAEMHPQNEHVHDATCFLLNSLGHIEFDAGDLDGALAHFQEFLALCRNLNTPASMYSTGVLLTISKIHQMKGNVDESIASSKEALATSREQRREVALDSHQAGRSIESLNRTSSSCDISQEDGMSFIPFVQVYNEDHKKQIRRDSLKGCMMKVFYTSSTARAQAVEILQDVAEMMAFLAEDAKHILSSPDSTLAQQEEIFVNLLFDGCNLSLNMIDSYAPAVYGIEISDRLFWEAFVIPHDMSMFRNATPIKGFNPPTRRSSKPEIQQKTLDVLHRSSSKTSHPLAAIPVVMQMDSESPMSPQTLVVAWEKEGKVLPANGLTASDFYNGGVD